LTEERHWVLFFNRCTGFFFWFIYEFQTKKPTTYRVEEKRNLIKELEKL
jgi:hypothetical protein